LCGLFFALTTGALIPLGFIPLVVHTSTQLMFLIVVGMSIPAFALFAFGQVVGDIRIIRKNTQVQSEHLEAMRVYYEPANRPSKTKWG
jgi:hypothetical protein